MSKTEQELKDQVEAEAAEAAAGEPSSDEIKVFDAAFDKAMYRALIKKTLAELPNGKSHVDHLKKWVEDIKKDQTDIPPEFAKILDEHLMELLKN